MPLVENPGAASAEWYKKTGVYPINHTLVVKDELLAANPSLGKDLYDAFKRRATSTWRGWRTAPTRRTRR